MMEFLSPGIYRSESAPGVQTISGVSAGTLALFGVTERGPIGKVVPVFSWSEFAKKFGSGGYVADAAYAIYRTVPGVRILVGRICHYTDPSDPSTATPVASKVVLKDRGATPLDTLEVAAITPGKWGDTLSVKIEDDGTDAFKFLVLESGIIRETFRGLKMDKTSSQYAVNVINARSEYVRVTDKNSTSPAPTNRPAVGTLTLTAGDDGQAVVQADWIGDADAGTGIHGLDVYEEEGILLGVPGLQIPATQKAIVDYAEARGDVFVVLEAPFGANETDTVNHIATAGFNSDYAALYWPNPYGIDQKTGLARLMPATGFVMGAHARTDTAIGPWQVAAGITNGRLVGVVGLEFDSVQKKAVRDYIYPYRINPIRYMQRYGPVIWGSRTLAAGGATQLGDINARRTMIYAQKSIEQGTAWVLFENNDERLWKRITASARAFLLDLWRAGGLKGATPDEAFQVKCDAETNPPSQVAQGIVAAKFGLALQTPAQFVWFDWYRYTGATETTQAAAASGAAAGATGQ